MGTGTLVHSLGSMNLSPMILSNQAKKLLNNKKLPKSLAVSFIFLTFATTFARVMGWGHGDRYIGSVFMVDEPVPDDLEPTNNHNQKVISVIIKKK